ncbi:hypothetical protein J7K25_00885 [bacterium]|nr:hypothetical protein [bacterium]
MATGNEIEIIQGDTRILVFIAVDEDGRVLDLRGADKVYFSVKATEESENYLIHKEGVIEIAENGVVTVMLTKEDTFLEPGNYWYDCEVWFSKGAMVYTIAKDRFKVIREITAVRSYVS